MSLISRIPILPKTLRSIQNALLQSDRKDALLAGQLSIAHLRSEEDKFAEQERKASRIFFYKKIITVKRIFLKSRFKL